MKLKWKIFEIFYTVFAYFEHIISTATTLLVEFLQQLQEDHFHLFYTRNVSKHQNKAWLLVFKI